MSNSAEVLEVFAEATKPRQVEKDVARFNPHVQPKRRRGREKMDPFDRFMLKVKKGPNPDDCWIYSGSVRFHVSCGGTRKKRKNVAVEFRKYMWQQVYGTEPPGLIYTSCRNGKCCNPKHLTTKHPGFVERSRALVTPTPRSRAGVTPLPVLPTTTATTEQVLITILQTISALDESGRTRVVAALKAFYP